MDKTYIIRLQMLPWLLPVSEGPLRQVMCFFWRGVYRKASSLLHVWCQRIKGFMAWQNSLPRFFLFVLFQRYANRKERDTYTLVEHKIGAISIVHNILNGRIVYVIKNIVTWGLSGQTSIITRTLYCGCLKRHISPFLKTQN